MVDLIPVGQDGSDQLLPNKLLGSFSKSSQRGKHSETLVPRDFIEESTHHDCAFKQCILAGIVVVLTDNAMTKVRQHVQEK
jgi:hypothetical protein